MTTILGLSAHAVADSNSIEFFHRDPQHLVGRFRDSTSMGLV